MGQLASRQDESKQTINFSSLLKTLLNMRDQQLLSDEQFSELIETACTVMIEKRVAHAVEKVVEHQINVNVLMKLLAK